MVFFFNFQPDSDSNEDAALAMGRLSLNTKTQHWSAPTPTTLSYACSDAESQTDLLTDVVSATNNATPAFTETSTPDLITVGIQTVTSPTCTDTESQTDTYTCDKQTETTTANKTQRRQRMRNNSTPSKPKKNSNISTTSDGFPRFSMTPQEAAIQKKACRDFLSSYYKLD